MESICQKVKLSEITFSAVKQMSKISSAADAHENIRDYDIVIKAVGLRTDKKTCPANLPPKYDPIIPQP